MTISTQDANRRRLFAASAAAVWIAAGLGYIILEAIAAARFRYHYSYAHDFISDLGITSRGMFQGHTIDSPLAYLMNTAFCLQGALFLVGAVLIVRALEAQWAGLFLALGRRQCGRQHYAGNVPQRTRGARRRNHMGSSDRRGACDPRRQRGHPGWVFRLFGAPMGRRGIAAYRPGSVC